MKTLQEYIDEKLIINKGTQLPKVDLTSIDRMICVSFIYKYSDDNFNAKQFDVTYHYINDIYSDGPRTYKIKATRKPRNIYEPGDVWKLTPDNSILWNNVEERSCMLLHLLLNPKYNKIILSMLSDMLKDDTYNMSIYDFFKLLNTDIPSEIKKLWGEYMLNDKYIIDVSLNTAAIKSLISKI